MLKEVIRNIGEPGGLHRVIVQNHAAVDATLRRLKSILKDAGIHYTCGSTRPSVDIAGSEIVVSSINSPSSHCCRHTGIYFDHACYVDDLILQSVQHVAPMILVKDEYI